MRKQLNALLDRAGLQVVRTDRGPDLPPDFDAQTAGIVERVRPETMTSPERVAAVVQAVRYVDRFAIPGAFVECGVWRGGSSMAAALAHQAAGPPSRQFYLYDTFEGMPPPTEVDVEHQGRPASVALEEEDRGGDVWAIAALEVVTANMRSTGLPDHLLHCVQGKVEDTVPQTLPSQIAVLRLDTDWYESTRHELEHLVPLVSPGGVLIIDDYGHWQGARRAVDEWLAACERPVLLNRTDYTGRIAVLP